MPTESPRHFSNVRDAPCHYRYSANETRGPHAGGTRMWFLDNLAQDPAPTLRGPYSGRDAAHPYLGRTTAWALPLTNGRISRRHGALLRVRVERESASTRWCAIDRVGEPVLSPAHAVRRAQRRGRADGHRQWRSVAHRHGPRDIGTSSYRDCPACMNYGYIRAQRKCSSPPVQHRLPPSTFFSFSYGYTSSKAPKPATLTTAFGSGLGETFSAVEGDVSSSEPQTSLASPSSKSGLIAAKGKVVKREESHDLDMTPGFMTLLRGTAAPRSGEVHLRNREMEVGALGPLCALVKVRRYSSGFVGKSVYNTATFCFFFAFSGNL